MYEKFLKDIENCIEFESITDAGKHLGKSYLQMSRYIKRNNDKDFIWKILN